MLADLIAENAVPIRPVVLLNFFVSIVTFSIGLRVSRGELFGVLRQRALFFRILVANCLLVPAVGFLLVHIFPVATEARIGILLLAAIPGTPIALQFTRKAETRLAFAASMTFVLSVVSIAMTPLAVEVIPETVQLDERPVLLLVSSIILYIALPLVAGAFTQQHLPKFARKLVLPIGLLASAVFFFLMWETRLLRSKAFDAISGGGAVLAMVLLLVISMAIGWFIGGSDRESRSVLATATGMRSVIVVLYVARYCFPGSNVYMVPLVYVSLMVPANLLFRLSMSAWNKFHPEQLETPERESRA